MLGNLAQVVGSCEIHGLKGGNQALRKQSGVAGCVSGVPYASLRNSYSNLIAGAGKTVLVRSSNKVFPVSRSNKTDIAIVVDHLRTCLADPETSYHHQICHFEL